MTSIRLSSAVVNPVQELRTPLVEHLVVCSFRNVVVLFSSNVLIVVCVEDVESCFVLVLGQGAVTYSHNIQSVHTRV